MKLREHRAVGFTLIELVVVVAIIAVLAAVLIPITGNLINKAKMTSGARQALSLRTTLTRFLDKFSTYPACDQGNPQVLGNCHSTNINNFFNREDVLAIWLNQRVSNDPFGNPWTFHWHPNSNERHWLSSYGRNRQDDVWRCWNSGPSSCGGDDFVEWLGRGNEY